jgi:hypothetical protein
MGLCVQEPICTLFIQIHCFALFSTFHLVKCLGIEESLPFHVVFHLFHSIQLIKSTWSGMILRFHLEKYHGISESTLWHVIFSSFLLFSHGIVENHVPWNHLSHSSACPLDCILFPSCSAVGSGGSFASLCTDNPSKSSDSSMSAVFYRAFGNGEETLKTSKDPMRLMPAWEGCRLLIRHEYHSIRLCIPSYPVWTYHSSCPLELVVFLMAHWRPWLLKT